MALLETSPLLSYLFFTYVISAKAAPGSPVSDQNEELSALKIRSERLESELAAAQVALAEAQIVVESLRAEVQQVKSDMVGDRSRQTAILEQKEGEKEDLHRQAQKYKVRRHRKPCMSVRNLILTRPSLKARLCKRL